MWKVCCYGVYLVSVIFLYGHNDQHGFSCLTKQPSPVLTLSVTSPLGKFRIFYDTTGEHRVPTEDKNRNGIPDYIDAVGVAFDSAWIFLVDVIGFPPPPLQDSTYSVYVQNLGSSGIYGRTSLDTYIGKNGLADRYTSFIVIDNDYSPFDSANGIPSFYTTGIDAVKITAVHEFFHAIHVGVYGVRFDQQLFYEMSSVWAEIRRYPSIPDYVQYARHLLLFPDRVPFRNATDGFAGYAYGIFLWYCTERGGDSVLLKMWEIFPSAQNCYFAMESAVASTGQSFLELWCDFLSKLLYTNKRSSMISNPLLHADLLPYPQPELLRNFRESTIVEGNLQPLEFRFFRFTLPSASLFYDTLEFVVCALDYQSVKNGIDLSIPFTLQLGKGLQNLIPKHSIGWSDWYGNGSGCTHIAVLTPTTAIVQLPYPQPFRYRGNRMLTFPIPRIIGKADEVTVEIFDAAYQFLGAVSLQPQLHNGQWGVQWDGLLNGAQLSSGVYFYRVIGEDAKIVGKFFIQNGY